MKVVEIAIKKKELINSRKDWIMITGFPGFGYVGTIATRYLAETMNMPKAGDIITRYMPDFASIEDYGVMTPYEIFADSEKGIIVVVNNVAPSIRERVAYAKELLRWFREIGGTRVILAAGLSNKYKESEERFRWMCVGECGWSFTEPMFKGMYIVGPAATLLTIANLISVPLLGILPYTEPAKYDPKAAAVFVEVVSDLLGLGVSVDKLMEFAKVVENIEKTVEQALSEEESKKPGLYM
jgi:uncharacterized protein